MTNLQLLLSVGIPSLLILLSWFNNNQRLTAMEKRIDGVEARLERQDRRFDEVLSSGHKDALEIMRSMTALHERVAIVESKQG